LIYQRGFENDCGERRGRNWRKRGKKYRSSDGLRAIAI
jgi:hypothetical protein